MTGKLLAKNWIPWCAISALFVAATLIVRPWVNSPLNDDWVYARAVESLVELGRTNMIPGVIARNLPLVTVGAVLTKLFGFSFFGLRLIGMAFGLGSLFLMYALSRSLLATVMLAATPLFFPLAFSAMSDVPALFFTLLAALLFIKKRWLTGSLAVVAGTVTRHTNIFLLGGLALAWLSSKITRRDMGRRGFVAVFAVLAVTCSLALLFWSRWNAGALLHVMPTDGTVWVKESALRLTDAIFYLGFLALPLGIALWFERLRTRIVITGAVLLVLLVLSDLSFPFLGNMVSSAGIGPMASVLQGTPRAVIPDWVMLGLAVASALSLAGLLSIRRPQLPAFAWWFIGLTLALVAALESFDRYLLPVLPFVLIAGIRSLTFNRIQIALCYVLTALVLALTIAGTHQYFRWHEARVRLAERLVAQGIARDQIEAGYEWTGWHLANRPREHVMNFTPEWSPWYIKQYAPGHPMDYIISFTPLGGYEVIDREDGLFASRVVARALMIDDEEIKR